MTIAEYMTALVATLTTGFPGLTDRIYINPDKMTGITAPALILRAADFAHGPGQDAMYVTIEGHLVWQGVNSPSVAAYLYAWIYRQASLHRRASTGVRISWVGFRADLGGPHYVLSWDVQLPNDYTLDPIHVDGVVLREVAISINGGPDLTVEA